MTFLGSRSIVFLGTPEPAARVLSVLIAERFPIDAVVTRVDARRGRGGSLSPSPVKKVALEAGIEVHHDLDWLAAPGSRDRLGVVVAYGRIIPARILASTPMVNLHFSLLPRWRGAAPVERAILAGDEQTGVCVMKVVEELDAGGVYAKTEIPVGSSNAADLTVRLADAGARLLVGVLRGDVIDAAPQSGDVTYAEKIRADEALIDWKADARTVVRTVRALRAHTLVDGRRLIVHDVSECGSEVHLADGPPGTCNPDGVVSCGSGAVRLVTVQPEGRSAMEAGQWRRGRRVELLLLGR